MKFDKNRIIRIIVGLTAVVIVLGLVTIAINSVLPGFIDVLALGDREAVQEYLRGFNDFGGYAVGFLLQFVQIITVFLPSVPIQLAIGIIFGSWKGFLICYSGYVSANAAVFLISRKLGSSLEKILPSGTVNSKNRMKTNFLLDSEHPAFTVFIASIIPVIPNGVIPYVAAKTKISFTAFISSVAIGCIPTVYTLCAIGGRLNEFNYLSAGLMLLPLLALVGILIWQKNNLVNAYEWIIKKIRKGQK